MWVMCVYVRAQYLNRKSGKYCFRLGKQRAEEGERERKREREREIKSKQIHENQGMHQF